MHLVCFLFLQVIHFLVPCVQNFGAPSFDDKKLEVVAVFGSMQMAVSRVINIQHHRIAQVTHTHHRITQVTSHTLTHKPSIHASQSHFKVLKTVEIIFN